MLFSILDKMEQGEEALDDADLPYLMPYADAAFKQLGGEMRFLTRLGDKAPKAWKEAFGTTMSYRVFLRADNGKLSKTLAELFEDVLLMSEDGGADGGLVDLMGQYMSLALLEEDTKTFRRLTAMTERLATKSPHITLQKVFEWNNEALRKIALLKDNQAAMRHIISCVPPLGCEDRKAVLKDWLLTGYRGAYMIIDSYYRGNVEMQELIIRCARNAGAEAEVLKFAGPHTICHAIQSGDPETVKKNWRRLARHSTPEDMNKYALYEEGALLWSGLKNDKSIKGAAEFLSTVHKEFGKESLQTLLNEEWIFGPEIHEGAVPLLTEFVRGFLGEDALRERLQKDKYEVFLNAAVSRRSVFFADLLRVVKDMTVTVEGKDVDFTAHMFADNDAHLLKEILVAGSLENMALTLMHLGAAGHKDVIEKAVMSGVITKAKDRADFLERLGIIIDAASALELEGVAIPESAQKLICEEKPPAHELWQRLGGEGARWENVANRKPPEGVNEAFSPYNFKPQLYDQILPYAEKILKLEMGKSEYAPMMAYKLAVLFSNKDEVERFLDKTIERFKPHDYGRPVSRAVEFELPLRGMWTVPHWRGLTQRYGRAASRFMGCAGDIEDYCREKDVPLPRTPQEIRDIARIVVYDPEEKHLEFAGLAIDFNLAAGLYDKGVQVLEEGLKSESYLPDIAIDGADIGKDNYYMEKLPDHDPRGLVLGEITNCCQSLGNNGEYAAVAGMKDAESGFYVWKHKTKGKITPDDRIVAQSWAWLSADRQALVFDSFERLSPAYNHLASPFIEQFAHEAKAAKTLQAVFVGVEGETPKDNSWQEKIQRPFALYRDGITEKSDSEEVYPVAPRDHRAQHQPGGGVAPQATVAARPS